MQEAPCGRMKKLCSMSIFLLQFRHRVYICSEHEHMSHLKDGLANETRLPCHHATSHEMQRPTKYQMSFQG
ncbi:hypothetical protein DVU_3130 [Nitratidesulfovibrio vulgaris str. Hildenborough]|uniref:Uncharacterized protein n=1 Tax=Nitratidesulfovibrio vulgaris (strain ATCC 29579 / DSM 644 / CCUG 34227 / NCIMB 8303 / VKM B-1760 / Hildenborough) TaxID=882 RepID=Q726H8_NITV2|nr:hypothetical protein DVU_3130 [Nitratidesulfovibrio vulgaris str. Hildenborough]